MTGKIAEVFDSIQGEGLYFGEKQIFVRFFGCNLKCAYCDTRFSYFTEYSSEELLNQIKSFQGQHHSISFTGGEPLIQKDFLKEILFHTRLDGKSNYLETNGTLPDALREVIPYLDIIAMDIKLPSSSQTEQLWDVHRSFLKIASEKEAFVKVVIGKNTKEEDLIECIKIIKDADKSTLLVLQPNSNEDIKEIQDKLEHFKELCLKQEVISCIIPQMHKIAGIK